MKRQFKACMAIILVMTLLLSMAGCGGTATPAATTAAATTAPESQAPEATAAPTATSAPASESATEPVASPPEKVTINIMTEMNTGITVPGVQDDQVAKEIERLTGITMNIENVEGSLIVPKVSAMIAAGDLPDLFVYDGDKPTMQTLIDSDSMLDLTALAESKLPNWMAKEKTKFALEFSKMYLSGGTGKLFNIPVMNGVNGSPAALTAGAFIRWDLYKELGYPPVKDILDIVPVLKQMVEKHPKTAEGKPVYGAGFWSDWAIWPVSVFGFIDGYAEANSLGVIDISNEKFVPILDESSIFWKYTKFYNKVSQAGILDPDSYTMKEQDWEAKATAGQEYFLINGWLNQSWKGTPDQGYAVIDTTGTSDKSYGNWGNAVGVFYAVSKKTKVADRVMDLLNFFADDAAIRMLLNGVEGQTWEMVGGKPQFKEGILAIVEDSNNPEAAKFGYKKYSAMAALAGGEKDSAGQPYDFKFTPEFIAGSQTAVEKDCAAFYKVALPSDVYNSKKYTNYGNALMAAIPAISDAAYEQKYTNIDTYITNNWMKLIQAKNDAAYDTVKAKFIKDLKEMGWDDVLTQFMKTYDETKAKLDAVK